ncbi:MAG: hypothetical protein SNJ52_01510 [Verrucomicrobiia bacterium]
MTGDIKSRLSKASKTLSSVEEYLPLLSADLQSELVSALDAFSTQIESICDQSLGKLKKSYWAIVPTWLRLFSGRIDKLRAQWKAARWPTISPRNQSEPEGTYLRRLLKLALDQQGKKDVETFLKAAQKHFDAIGADQPTELVPKPELNEFLREIGRLTRAEATPLIKAKGNKFLKQVAAMRRLTFTEVDASFIRRLHESATKFVRNTAI